MTRLRPWLLLARRLTSSAPTWGVWKRPNSALEGEGDIDAVASEEDWGTVVDEYRSWASEQAFDPVLVCRHVPGLLILVACEDEQPGGLVQMDVYSDLVFRGARLLRASDLQALMRVDPRGFRRLRPGAEGVLLLLAEAVRRGSKPPDPATVNEIAALLREDPEGAEETAGAIGPRGRHLLAGAQALAGGGWDRRELALFELKSAARLLGHPVELATCVVRDVRGLRPCAVVTALEAERGIPGDRDQWLEQVRRSHAVYATASP